MVAIITNQPDHGIEVEQCSGSSSPDSSPQLLKKQNSTVFSEVNQGIRKIFSGHQPNSIIHVVQMSRIFPDSKTFVDMKLNESPILVQNAFDRLMEENNNSPSNEIIASFVQKYFTLENQMEDFTPADWKVSPDFINHITDSRFRQFAIDLNFRWQILCRKIKNDVEVNQDLYTLIYLPHPVVVPGGRFREIYYWDSFWIIRGLLLSEMYDTVRGMLLNFVHLIQIYGLIPNGGRTYYINRSQPPLFIQMVDEYVKATGDEQFVKDNWKFLVREFEYWAQHHFTTVVKNGQTYRLARFNCEDEGPRPESYFEDYELVEQYAQTLEEKANLYWEMKTGAETGWDYSSRWMIKDGGNTGELHDTKARFIIPVDLNSFIALNAQILSRYAKDIIQNEVSALLYQKFADDLVDAIDNVLWDDDEGVWLDFDMINCKTRKYFSPSNLVPLYTETMSKGNRSNQIHSALSYLLKHDITQHPGGLPTTFSVTGQQWDFPNCWPPLEHMVVLGLERTNIPEAQDLAFQIASKRVEGSFNNFIAKGHMFEKYDALSSMRIGGGGEYEIQIGFGWTNGVVMDFLNMYNKRLVSPAIVEIEQRAEEEAHEEEVDPEEALQEIISETPALQEQNEE